MQPNENARAAVALLQQRGYTPNAAAGITGNLMQESSVNPTTRPGDHGTAHGIAQWRGDRWIGAQRYAQQSGGNLSSLATQIGWLDQELRTRYPNAYRAVMSARSPEEAAGAFGLLYERPAGAQTGIARNIDGYANRVNVARSLAGMAPMAFNDASAIGGRANTYGPGFAGNPNARDRMGASYGPELADAPQVTDAIADYRHGSGDIESPGELDLSGLESGGGGGGGGSTTPGSNDTDLSGVSAGSGAVDPEAFAQDQSGVSDIQNRLASIKQNAAMGQGADIGEVTPLGKVFDLAKYDAVGAAGRRA